MAIEIERKYLLKNNAWRSIIQSSTVFKQGYFGKVGKASVRIRIEGDQANINIKSAELGIYRQEYEYAIPLDEAQEMLENLCESPIIEKTRHIVVVEQKKWEIDEFSGDNAGLIVAEVELESVDESIELPHWVGNEVSDDPRYYNVSLVAHPFKDWKK